MRLQFAFAEALIMLLSVLALLSAYTAMADNYSGSAYAAAVGLKASAAEYDFMNEMLQNATAMRCLEAYYASNSTCMHKYAEMYTRIYGLASFSVYRPGEGSVNARCFAFNLSIISEICIYAG